MARRLLRVILMAMDLDDIIISGTGDYPRKYFIATSRWKIYYQTIA